MLLRLQGFPSEPTLPHQGRPILPWSSAIEYAAMANLVLVLIAFDARDGIMPKMKLSRTSPTCDIRIDKEGIWFYEGAEMRRDIVGLFYQHLQRDAAGRYLIEMGERCCCIEVEDTAYVVWAVRWSPEENGAEECFHLHLSDGSVESLDLCTFRIGKDNIPYCRVKNNRFDARFSRAGYYQITEHIKHDPVRDCCFILLNGQPYYFATLSDPAAV